MEDMDSVHGLPSDDESLRALPFLNVARACAAHPDDCPNGPEPHAFVPPDAHLFCCCRQSWEEDYPP